MLRIMVLMANEEGRDLMDIKFCIVYDEAESCKCDASSSCCRRHLKRFQQTFYWLRYEGETARARVSKRAQTELLTLSVLSYEFRIFATTGNTSEMKARVNPPVK